ncbi:hypothetical protein Sjap_005683 [Stephania japonica]|uniref:Uncharacterized protein n=1 Tax=Stephania japonica TaxID=461633 RepID=A0AAP0PLD4_9MAGN
MEYRGSLRKALQRLHKGIRFAALSKERGSHVRWGMARTKRTEDVKKAKEARKNEEVNKKTAENGKRVGRRAQTASYKKSKELGRTKGDSELYDDASATPEKRELAIRSSQVISTEVSSPKSSEEDQEKAQDQSAEEKEREEESEDGNETQNEEKK